MTNVFPVIFAQLKLLFQQRHCSVSLRLIFAFVLGISFQLSAQDSTPDQIQQRYQQGLAAMNAFQFEKAIPHFNECHREDNDNLNFLQQLGYCYYKIGNYRDAKLFFKKMLQLDSLNVQALSYLGTVAEQEYNYQDAKNYYGQLLESDTTNSYYYKLNAYMAVKTNQVLPAIAFFRKAYDLNPMDIEVIERLSAIYLELEQPEMADEMLQLGLRLDANNIRLLQLDARIQNKLKNYERVIASIEKIMAQGDTTAYYQMMIGVDYMRLDSIDKGIFHLEQIVQRQEDNEHTHHYLGTGYQKRKDFAKSEEHYQKAIERGISPKIALYYQDLASIYEEKGDYKKAIECYQKSYEYEPAKEVLFHLARNHDLYYKDKRMAMRFYEQYYNSGHEKYRKYADERITQLKEIIHFYK